MNTFRFLWNTHKWVGVSIASFLVISAITGFLLLIKKEAEWIQPPTQEGSAGSVESFISMEEAWQRVKAENHPDFREFSDIDRIDVRPEERVYKVRSKHNHSEIQVDAITGKVLSSATRRSDWLENIHDGSWIAKPVHDYVMPLVAICVLFMVFSGFWIWLSPIIRRRRHRRKQASS